MQFSSRLLLAPILTLCFLLITTAALAQSLIGDEVACVDVVANFGPCDLAVQTAIVGGGVEFDDGLVHVDIDANSIIFSSTGGGLAVVPSQLRSVILILMFPALSLVLISL